MRRQLFIANGRWDRYRPHPLPNPVRGRCLPLRIIHLHKGMTRGFHLLHNYILPLFKACIYLCQGFLAGFIKGFLIFRRKNSI